MRFSQKSAICVIIGWSLNMPIFVTIREHPDTARAVGGKTVAELKQALGTKP